MRNRKLMTEAKEISKMMKLANLGSYSKKVLKEGRFGAEEDEEEEALDAPEDEMGDDLGDEDTMGDEPTEMPDVDIAPEPAMGAPAGGASSPEDVADAIIKALQGLGLVDVVDDDESLEGTADELPEPEAEDEAPDDDESMLQEKVLQRVKKRIMAEKVTHNVIRRLKEMQAAGKKPAPKKPVAAPKKK